MFKNSSKRSGQTTTDQVNPGTSANVYEIETTAGSNLGWLVEVAGSNVTSGQYTWLANTAYWFWGSTPFPSSFRLKFSASGVRQGVDPGTATTQNSSGPFDTSQTVTPTTSASNWWSIALVNGGSTAIGYLGTTGGSGGGTQYWYETAANAYISIPSGSALVFSGASRSSTPMYECISAPT